MRKEDKDYNRFKEKIYNYCYENAGQKGLFSVFVDLVYEGDFVKKRNLVHKVEKITRELVEEGILVEIEKPENLESPYGYYKINPPKDLSKVNGYLVKKLKYLD